MSFGEEYSQPRRRLPFFKAWLLFFITEWFLQFGALMLLTTVASAVTGDEWMTDGKASFVWWVILGSLFLPISYICYRWSITKFIFPEAGVRSYEYQ